MLVTSAGARSIGTAQPFEVRPLQNAPAGTDFNAVVAFQREASELSRRISGAGAEMGAAGNRLQHMRAALTGTPSADPGLFARLDALGETLQGLQIRLFGDRTRQQLNESNVPSIQNRVSRVIRGHWTTRQTPTATQRRNLDIGGSEFETLSRDLRALLDGQLADLEAALEAAGAPWTPGRQLPP